MKSGNKHFGLLYIYIGNNAFIHFVKPFINKASWTPSKYKNGENIAEGSALMSASWASMLM